MVRLDEEEVGTQEVREHHQSSENPKATSSFLELRNSSNHQHVVPEECL